MSGSSVRIEGYERAMQAMKRTASGVRIPLIISQLVTAGVKRNFVKGEDPDSGKAWLPPKHRDGQPLRDRGRLQRSIHGVVSGHGYESKITIGTNVIYAATHQFGDPDRKPKRAAVLVFTVFGVTVFARKVTIPARRYLPETDKGLDRTTDGKLAPTIHKYLKEQWT